jgi:P-type E1-E2 ATPase
VTDVVAAPGSSEEELLRAAAAAELPSEHPIGRAIVAGARAREIEPQWPQDFSSQAGFGVRARLGGRTVEVGRRSLLGDVPERLRKAAAGIERDGSTTAWVRVGDEVAGFLALADELKPAAAQAVAGLHAAGLETVMITGDNRPAAEAIARRAGIGRVLAEVMPAEKASEIARLQAEGNRVAMVGDGINDAPALAQADLGVAVGTGADVAIEASDVTIVSGDPRQAVTAIALSRRTLRVIKQNLFWAFAYNVAALPLAALGLLNPMIAAGAMALSSVSVVVNALRLRRFAL